MLDRIYGLLKDGISGNEDRELLAQSLFYYCCGKDPTPIIAFGSEYPLYVYSDIINYGDGDFDNETGMLYIRLCNEGYILVERRKFVHWENFKNVDITLWKTSQNKLFSLVYLQSDSVKVFQKVYSDSTNNYIQPKCICNYRYEFSDQYSYQDSYSFFQQIEKRTEYILGHCSNNKYKCVSEHDYYGIGEGDSKVTLYHRMFWYVY